MYHSIVKAKVTNLFGELSKGNFEPIVNGLAPEFEHSFSGQHALSGRRDSLVTTRKWYERLLRIFPGIRFELRNIAVSGWPWDTLVAVEWSDFFALATGKQGSNAGVNMIRLKWGKVVSVHIYCDTQLLLENLVIQHGAGISDAHAEPLIDRPQHASASGQIHRPAVAP